MKYNQNDISMKSCLSQYASSVNSINERCFAADLGEYGFCSQLCKDTFFNFTKTQLNNTCDIGNNMTLGDALSLEMVFIATSCVKIHDELCPQMVFDLPFDYSNCTLCVMRQDIVMLEISKNFPPYASSMIKEMDTALDICRNDPLVKVPSSSTNLKSILLWLLLI